MPRQSLQPAREKNAARPPARPARTFFLTISVIVLALFTGGCGAQRSSSAVHDVSLERVDLKIVSSALEKAERSVGREVAVAKEIWPSIAHGLPRQISPGLGSKSATASSRAGEILAPSFMTQAEGPISKQRRDLTGPAAGIAGLFQSFSILAERGWKQTSSNIADLQGTSTADANFVRSNASLYLSCLYDAHFDLASIGKSIIKAYLKLGGEEGFGASLPRSQVDQLAGFYSDQLKLEPHILYKLG